MNADSAVVEEVVDISPPLPDAVSEVDRLRLSEAHFKHQASQLALLQLPQVQHAQKVKEALEAVAKEVQDRYKMKDEDSIDVETGKIVRK